jgi:hypothetical protein
MVDLQGIGWCPVGSNPALSVPRRARTMFDLPQDLADAIAEAQEHAQDNAGDQQ